MDTEKFFKPSNLEYSAFLWSEIRLILAAAALVAGGTPLLSSMFPFPIVYGLVSLILLLAWVISGAAAGYLLYRWVKGGKILFGEKRPRDAYAFFVLVVSGINLGLTGLTSQNFGMRLLPYYPAFLVAAALYALSAAYLYGRWKQSGQRVFSSMPRRSAQG